MASIARRLEQAEQVEEATQFEVELGPLIADALRLATAMLSSPTDAEDAVQEACLLAWQRRSNRRAGTELRPWLLGIVANRCRETRRGRWWRMIRVAEVRAGEVSAAIDVADAVDMREALAQLRHRFRLAIVLRYYLDLSYEDVAAALGCSTDAAKALVRRGTARLERLLTVEESTHA